MFLGSNHSQIYPYRRATFGRVSSVVSKKRRSTYRHTHKWTLQLYIVDRAETFQARRRIHSPSSHESEVLCGAIQV